MFDKKSHSLSCLLLLTAVCWFSSGALHAQEDVRRFVPSSAIAALFAKPKAALSQPGMEFVPHEIITAFGKKEFGVDPCEITEVVGLVDSLADTEQPPKFALMVKFDSPQKLSAEAFARMNLEPDTWNGKVFHASRFEPEVGLLQFDEQTVIFGNRPMISKMLSAQGAKSGLIDQIAQSPPNGHLDLYVSIEPVRGLIKDNLPPASQIPPPFAEYLKLPDLINSLSIHSSAADGGHSKWQINAVDDESATALQELLRSGLAMAQQMILAQVANEMHNEDETLQVALQQYINRIGPHIRGLMEPQVDGKQLVFEFSSQQSGQATNVATIGVLVGLLLPAVQQVREAARRTQSMNQLRQCALAAHNYESAHQHFPAQANYSADGRPLLSWRVHLLPYLEGDALYRQFKLDESWDSPHNIKLLDRMPEFFRGPNSIHANKTVFLGVSGPGTIFDGQQGAKLSGITDGTSNTILFVEVNDDAAVEWTKPNDYEFNADDPAWGLLGARPGGFNVSLADGSARFISSNIDPETLKNLMLKADGNVVGNY